MVGRHAGMTSGMAGVPAGRHGPKTVVDSRAALCYKEGEWSVRPGMNAGSASLPA